MGAPASELGGFIAVFLFRPYSRVCFRRDIGGSDTFKPVYFQPGIGCRQRDRIVLIGALLEPDCENLLELKDYIG